MCFIFKNIWNACKNNHTTWKDFVLWKFIKVNVLNIQTIEENYVSSGILNSITLEKANLWTDSNKEIKLKAKHE